jgi:CRP-like cAMP-binding protein
MAGPAWRDELATLPLLEGASRAQIDGVAACMSLGTADPGDVLGREGEPGHVFWLLLEGRLAITVRTSSGRRSLGEAGAGAIVGELALLRHQPRTATVTAIDRCRFLSGDHEALEKLIGISVVRDRVRRLASSRLAQDARPVAVPLAHGGTVLLRPLLPSDRDALDSALHSLSQQSMRLRFFTPGAPSKELLDYLVDIDYVDHFAWAALDPADHRGTAVARYVRLPAGGPAEMAFTTLDRFQGRGIGSALLGAIGVAAREAGVAELVAHVLEDNRPMRAVLAKAGAETHYDEPGVVRVTVDPARAAGLLDPTTGAVLAGAVHDLVTAASLALT